MLVPVTARFDYFFLDDWENDLEGFDGVFLRWMGLVEVY